MIHNHLRLSEMIDSISDLADTIWLIMLGSGRAEILKDGMTPEIEGKELDYPVLCDLYRNKYVYPSDTASWDANMSLETLQEAADLGCSKKKTDMRFINGKFGFEWHEASFHWLTDENGVPDRVLLVSRNVNQQRKSSIVERAVETEYDYVVYIEADKNSYVMYSANHESETIVPPVVGEDYEQAVALFHDENVPEAERARMTEMLSIHHVQPMLEQEREYVVYGRMIENGKMRDKKMHFSYFDREKNIWLLTRTDITEIREEKRQKRLLQDALDSATAANRAKSEFLSRMSHDIRTPMNAIIGMTSIVGVHIDDRERVLDCLAKITSSSKLLLSLINEVLDMSKVESSRIVLSEEKINLAELVQGVVAMLQPGIDEKSLIFHARVNAVRHEDVIGDTQRLQQVLLNIMSNAVKYTTEGGRILLEVREKPSGESGVGCFEFLVEDSGIGMKPEFLEKIFQPFERADDAAVKALQGTGLGMAISKNVVEMMNGSIQVESIYGQGSRFTATVQLKIDKETAAEGELFVGLPVLIVDDDEVVCKYTCQRLDELGMNSQWVNNGKAAVEKTVDAHESGEDFFAVIVDLRMPGMDGIETTRQIRAKVGPEVPIIMISAYDWSEYEDEARKAGANGFIMKPLFRSRLVCQLKNFVGQEPVQKTEAAPVLLGGDFTGKRVLLVEDNELNQEIASEMLSSAGIIVETADNGEIAVCKVADSPERYFDLIFMDMQMPVMDGCKATMAIRSLPREDAGTVPIVAMTANAFAEDVRKAKSAGMNEHMAKPIDLDILTQTLYRWLA